MRELPFTPGDAFQDAISLELSRLAEISHSADLDYRALLARLDALARKIRNVTE